LDPDTDFSRAFAPTLIRNQAECYLRKQETGKKHKFSGVDVTYKSFVTNTMLLTIKPKGDWS